MYYFTKIETKKRNGLSHDLNPESWTKKLSGFYMSKEKRKKHGYAEVLKYMHLIKSGRTFNSIRREYGVNEGRLKVLWERYQKMGPSGLRKMKNIKADFSLKKKYYCPVRL